MKILINYLKAHPADSVSIGLLILGGIYRVVGLGSSAFWYDESYSLYLGSQPSVFLVSDGNFAIMVAHCGILLFGLRSTYSV